MKRFSKILCAVLMLALVCTSLAFLVSADGTPDDVISNATPQNMKDVVIGDVSGNLLSGSNVSWIQYEQRTDPDGNGKYNDGAKIEGQNQLDSYVVTPDGGDGYVVLWAGELQDGTSQWNAQNVYQYNGVELPSDSYYVVDLDIATPTELISGLNLSLPNRNVPGGDWANGGSGFPFGENVAFIDYLSDLGSEWVHFTVVNAMATNEQYVFVNGQFVGKTGKKAYNDTQLVSGTTLCANGIKIEVPYNDGNPSLHMINANESVAFDNVARRDLVDAASIAELDALLAQANPDLTTWSGYPTNVRTGSLPAYVEIDGVEYNNIGDANKALYGNEAKTVNVLNNFPGALFVSCDATINMNGFSGNVWVCDGATKTGEDVITVDSPYIQSKLSEASSDGNVIKSATEYALPGGSNNAWLSVTPVGVNGLDDGNNNTGAPLQGSPLNLVTNVLTGEKYFEMDACARGANTYLAMYSNTAVKKGDGQRYFVLDVDIALFSDVSTTLGWYAVCRGSTGCFGTNVRNGSFVSAVNAMPRGEMQHFTSVADLETNTIYTFLNGELISTVTSGVYGGSGASQYEAGFKFEQFRLFSSLEDSIAFDNVAIRNCGSDAEITAAISAGDISTWSGYYADDAGYEMTELAPIASVDGVKVYSASQLQSKLVGRDQKSVELFATLTETVEVNCDTTVKTNGVVATGLKCGAGVTSATDGENLTFDAPWTASVSTDELVSDANFIIDNSLSGNLYAGLSGFGLVNNGSGQLAMYKVTDTTTGNTYLKIAPTYEGYTAANIYLSTEKLGANPGEITKECVLKDGEGYFVHELDVATDSTMIQALTIDHVARNNAAEGGTFPFGAGVPISNYVNSVSGEWAHITVVGDLAANKEYVFVNGHLIGEAGNANNESGKYEYLNVKGIRLNLSTDVWLGKDDTVLVDNLSVRVFKSSPELAAAIEAGTLAGWSGNHTALGGTHTPVIATVNGTKCYTIAEVEAAIAASNNPTVEIDRGFFGKVTLDSSATVVDHGFTDKVVANVKNDVVIGGNHFSSDFRIVEEAGQTSYIKLDESNYASNTSMVEWYDEEFTEADVIYYPIGSEIVYLGGVNAPKVNYIEGGKLYNQTWWTDDEDGNPVQATTVIANGTDYYFYLVSDEPVDTAITVNKDVKYNMSLYANFDVNLYVPVENGVSGTTYTIGGVEHVLYTKSIAANNITSDLVFTIEFVVDSVTYTENVTVCVLDYAKAVLASDYSDAVKRVMMAALDYANEAYAIVNGGNGNSEILDVLGNPDNADYIVAENTEYGDFDNSQIQDVIDTAQLVIDAEGVSIVLKVNASYAGSIVVSCVDYKDAKVDLGSYTVEGGEVIKLPIKVYNLAHNIDIVAGELEGSYNLGAYVESLVSANASEAELAKALFTYAKVAEAYKNALKNV